LEAAVSRARLLVTVAAFAAAVWGLLVFAVVKPVSPTDFRRNVLQVATSAYDASRTGWLAGRQVLAGQLFSPFAQTAFDDAAKTLSGATKQFGSESPPTAASRQLRDALAPLLDSAVRKLGDASSASEDGDDAALRRAVDDLDRVAGQLDDFIEVHR
jgi:hypothetical protein